MRITTYRMEKNEDDLLVLVKERATNYGMDALDRPDKVAAMMNSVFRCNAEPEEHIWMLAMTSKSKIIGVFDISHGDVNSAIMPIGGIFKRILLTNAMGFILVHNHPGGSTNPSREDMNTTKRVKDAAGIMGIKFHDHIIIGNDDYYSFKMAEML